MTGNVSGCAYREVMADLCRCCRQPFGMPKTFGEIQSGKCVDCHREHDTTHPELNTP